MTAHLDVYNFKGYVAVYIYIYDIFMIYKHIKAKMFVIYIYIYLSIYLSITIIVCVCVQFSHHKKVWYRSVARPHPAKFLHETPSSRIPTNLETTTKVTTTQDVTVTG